jgi:tetratricopeptide (TPR) repeat protein
MITEKCEEIAKITDIYSMNILILLVLAGVITAVVFIARKGLHSKTAGKPKEKSRAAQIRDAQKKLAQNSHNSQALSDLSRLYYSEQQWEKAFPLLSTMFDIAPAHKEFNLAEIGLRLGICSLKLGRIEEGMHGLIESYKLDSDNFEVNYYLGEASFETKNYQNAIPCLKKALSFKPNAPNAIKWIGLSLYYQKHYKESLPYCNKALEADSSNTELLFAMAEGLENTGNRTKAFQVYQHLRNDPEYGSKSCFAAGMMYQNDNMPDKAIEAFEFALQSHTAPPELLNDLHYRLGAAYIKSGNLSKGLQNLQILQTESPGYKDVDNLINRYQEINQNSNLQVYLMGSNAEFTTLCRKIATAVFPKSRIHITEMVPHGEMVDMVAEVQTTKWEDVVLFRFIRSAGTVGELYIRELHEKLKDIKAGRGIYISAGIFQESARKFVEVRPIDLIDKTALVKILKSVGKS